MPLLFLAPPVVWLLIFFLLPLSTMILLSFWKYEIFRVSPDWTLENYRMILSSPAYFKALFNTFKFAVLTVLCSLLAGFPIAYFLAFVVQSHRTRLLLLMLCFIPFWTSYLIRVLAWLSIFGRKGLLNELLLSLGFIQQPTDVLLFSDASIVIAMTQIYVIFMIAAIMLSMHNIPSSVFEAARDSGASTFSIFKEVILPLSLPGIIVGSILVFVMAMGDFATVQIVGGFKVGTLATWVQNWASNYNYPMAAANGILLIISVIIGVWLMLRVMDIRRAL
jgi:putative spermidine/putrescine transport system permease protein